MPPSKNAGGILEKDQRKRMENSVNYNTKILTDGCEKLGITLSGRQIEQFMIYYEYLIEKNKVMNLTGITEFEEVMIKHFVDSLAIVKAADMNKITTLLDLGTGAGFPGIPLKIVFPQIEILLLDSLNKRIKFLNEVIDKCRLEKVKAIHGRAEEAARQKEYREYFDLCVSRAVANLSSLSEYCLPYVKTGGQFISYKSGNIDMEVREAETAIKTLGGQKREVICFQLPDSEIARSLVVIDKIKASPGKYPRKAGLPSREPLGKGGNRH